MEERKMKKNLTDRKEPWFLGGLKVVEECVLFREDETNMEKRYYIAYGSNLNIRQMRRRCPSARIIGTSEVSDYKLLFKGSKTGSYLTIEPKEGSSVPVAVWEVTEKDELALDQYEGCPNFYYKAEMTLSIKGIRSGKIRERTVFVYIMHENRAIGTPSISYLRTCLEGYDDFGFDSKILMNAYLESKGNEHEKE